jgi:tRNA pseudouridine55 synthase
VKTATHSIDGVLVLDKPQGLTSHDVVAVARRALGERRIGHTGTLDPLATGVLPLACGRATRLVRFLTASDKDYDATIRFGLTTDSYDVTGMETTRSGRQPEQDAVERALATLTGSYPQTPPAFSAKKVAGRRSYDRARLRRASGGAGPGDQAVELTPVPVTVTRAELEVLSGDTARVRVTSSAGFYVRSFAHSLGELVGTGACLEALRRTRSGDFTLGQAITLEQLSMGEATAAVIPLDTLLSAFRAVTVTDEGRTRVSHGQEVEDASGLPSAEWVRLMDGQGHLVAMATAGSRPGFLHPAVVLI